MQLAGVRALIIAQAFVVRFVIPIKLLPLATNAPVLPRLEINDYVLLLVRPRNPFLVPPIMNPVLVRGPVLPFLPLTPANRKLQAPRIAPFLLSALLPAATAVPPLISLSKLLNVLPAMAFRHDMMTASLVSAAVLVKQTAAAALDRVPFLRATAHRLGPIAARLSNRIPKLSALVTCKFPDVTLATAKGHVL